MGPRSMPTMRTAKFCSVRGTGVKGSGSEMWAQAGDEGGRADDEEGLAGEGILKRSETVGEGPVERGRQIA